MLHRNLLHIDSLVRYTNVGLAHYLFDLTTLPPLQKRGGGASYLRQTCYLPVQRQSVTDLSSTKCFSSQTLAFLLPFGEAGWGRKVL